MLPSSPCSCRPFTGGARARVHYLQRHHSRLHGKQLSFVTRRAALQAAETAASTSSDAVGCLYGWLLQDSRLGRCGVEPKRFVNEFGARVGLIATKDTPDDQVLLEIPEKLAITAVDASKHGQVGAVASECEELVALTLWYLAERAKGPSSAWHDFLQTLPTSTLSPILWDDAERQALLAGSPVLAEARSREALLRQQWDQLNEAHFSKQPSAFPTDVFNLQSFMNAFCVVLAHASYLPTAECFALLPLASLMGRTGNDNGCDMDYDVERQAVVVKPARPYREGQEVLLNDGRPNGELLLSTGDLQDGNSVDHLFFTASLLPADRYFTLKQQVLGEMGLVAQQQQFPVYADRMPIQLLAYLRLARLADPVLFAKVSFERDVILTDMNEYEILQLLMGDCRERFQAYKADYEDDVKMLQQNDLSPKQRLACRLRLAEQRILRSTMDAVRAKLAPIRGIPTKGGAMKDPNSDFKEIFDTLEAIPAMPSQLVGGIMAWARGDFDPEWNKGKKKPPPPPKDLR